MLNFCGYPRKYAISLLTQPVRIKKAILQKRGSKPKYRDESFVKALQRIWYGVDLICAKRLKVAIPLWLPYFQPFSSKQKK